MKDRSFFYGLDPALHHWAIDPPKGGKKAIKPLTVGALLWLSGLCFGVLAAGLWLGG